MDNLRWILIIAGAIVVAVVAIKIVLVVTAILFQVVTIAIMAAIVVGLLWLLVRSATGRKRAAE